MPLRKPLKVEVLEELHQRLAELRERAVAVGWQPHEVYEHALFFGLPAAVVQVERAERAAEQYRNAQRLNGSPLHA